MNIFVPIYTKKYIIFICGILILSVIFSNCSQNDTISCIDSKQVSIEKNIDMGNKLEDWLVYVHWEDPNLLYDNIEKFKQKTENELFPLIKDSVIECIISVEKNGLKKVFSINDKTKNIYKIRDVGIYVGGGSSTVRRGKYPYTSSGFSKLINCEIDGESYNCILYIKDQISYDNGIIITVECFVSI